MDPKTQDGLFSIGILGAGTMAEALGRGWARAGHHLTIGGRTIPRAEALATRIGGQTTASDLRHAATGRDVVLLAVAWDGVPSTLQAAGAGENTLAGTTLIDCTNAVRHGIGTLFAEVTDSAAERIAAQAAGAHVVKAFNIFPASTWTDVEVTAGRYSPVVALAGDHTPALQLASTLVRHAGGTPAVLGPLARARQIEDTAGFVIGLAFAGHNPADAIPALP